MSVEELKKDHNVVTRWVHFPLHPETPDEGVALDTLFSDRPAEQIQEMRAQMKARMEDAGLPYGDRTKTYNSRLAQELGAWADDKHPGSRIHDELFTAYFVDNRNIGDKTELVNIAVAAGLDEAQAQHILDTRIYSPAVNADWQRAWDNGITGVPTFTARDLYVVGCQPYEVLVRFLTHLQQLQTDEAARQR